MAISQFIERLEYHLQGQVCLQHVEMLKEAFVMAKLHDTVLTPQHTNKIDNLPFSPKTLNYAASSTNDVSVHNMPLASARNAALINVLP